MPDVSAVSAPGGHVRRRPTTSDRPSAATGVTDGSAFLTVGSTAPLFSDASETQLDRLHAVRAPGGPRRSQLTGIAQINRDSVDAITSRLPIVLGVIAVITFVLLFLLTGSVVLPLKALVLNVLVADGGVRRAGVDLPGRPPRRVRAPHRPGRWWPTCRCCCSASRSGCRWTTRSSSCRGSASTGSASAAGEPRADNDESVALGLARTGRVVTAAALLMSISFAALIAAQVAFMRMFGLGLTLAVLVDATLVRMVLVPAFMHVLGRWNWWAPEPLARLHHRIGGWVH